MSTMGRPRLHDDRTRAALLEAAERIVETEGSGSLSVRGVADSAGTTARAVYTVFGSKDGLLIALGERAFELLGEAVDALPVTDDPAADLVTAGAVGFRTFVLHHPTLFQVGVQRTALPPHVTAGFSGAATSALRSLQDRVARLEADGALGNRSVAEATWEYHALCEGLAAVELRHRYATEQAGKLWTDALRALVAGWNLC